MQEEDKKRVNKPTGKIENSKDSKRSRLECPRCGEVAHLTWILNKNYGLCTSCGNNWLIEDSL